MSFQSGFGLAAIFPALVTDAPGVAYFQTGGAGLIDMYLKSATGSPQVLFSVFSGTQPPLDFVSGLGSSFFFDQGKMTFGRGSIDTTPTATGDLNIFWNSNSQNSQAGLIIHNTDTNIGSGKPVTIHRTSNDTDYLEKSLFLGRRAEFRSNLGGYKTQLLPGPMAYEAVNVFASDAFGSPVTDGANDPLAFDGFGWGRWDAASNLFTNLALHKDYVEIGNWQQTSTKQNIGGLGSVVIRQGASPSSYHTSGTTLFSSGDGSFNLITASGKALQLGPGLTGFNSFANSNDIYKDIDFGLSSSAIIDSSFDGKIAIN